MIDRVIEAWSGIAQEDLRSILRAIDRPVPPALIGFYLDGHRIGALAPEHVAPLLQALPQCRVQAHGVAVPPPSGHHAQYAYDNPAYYWMDGAYLVCAMRECGWKMVPYTDFDGEGTHHHLHNGSGVQLFFRKVAG